MRGRGGRSWLRGVGLLGLGLLLSIRGGLLGIREDVGRELVVGWMRKEGERFGGDGMHAWI